MTAYRYRWSLLGLLPLFAGGALSLAGCASQTLHVDDRVVEDPEALLEARLARAPGDPIALEAELDREVHTLQDLFEGSAGLRGELIYQVYTDLEWPTSHLIGRYTISPDNVAVRALGEGPLRVMLLYLDGERVRSEVDERFAGLLDDSREEGNR